MLSEEGLRVQVVTLSDGHDPDTFLKQFGAAAFRERLAQAPEFMEWLMERAAAEHDIASPAGKAATGCRVTRRWNWPAALFSTR